MMKVLINAYACSPDMGSEPGMAWNWCSHLAKYCELFIITEGEFKDKIETTLSKLSQGKNMHFYYNPVSEEIRKMCWNQGDWRFYKYYREWQYKTYQIAKEICDKEQVDLLHQLNMIGFREPGYLWRLSKERDIPFVWGPVDAKDKFPVSYLQGAPLRDKLFVILKNLISVLQLKYSKRVHEASEQASRIFAASSNSVRSFKKYLRKDSILINETGCSDFVLSRQKQKSNDVFNILWVGKTDFRKQLALAIRIIAALKSKAFKLHIVGGGDYSGYVDLANSLGIYDQCVWHGVVNHEEVQDMMSKSDILLFTSVAEGTPHVVLEAIANSLPVLCFDTCGQGDVVNDEVGIKIPLTNPSQSVSDFADSIIKLYNNREILDNMSMNCVDRAKTLSWDNKAIHMKEIYERITDSRTIGGGNQCLILSIAFNKNLKRYA
jgi:glycosyltransferase involved in cell wall biosynthesis